MVLAIITILTTLAAPKFKSWKEIIDLHNTTRQIKGQLDFAKVRALTNPLVHCGVYFKTSSPSYSAIFFDTAMVGSYDYNMGQDPLYQAALEIPPGLNVSLSIPGGKDEVIFRGDGSSNTNANIIISNGFMSDTINILASTGRIKILK